MLPSWIRSISGKRPAVVPARDRDDEAQVRLHELVLHDPRVGRRGAHLLDVLLEASRWPAGAARSRAGPTSGLGRLIERGLLLRLVGLLAEPARGLLGVRDPEAVAVGEANGLRERRAVGAVLLLLVARELVALLLEGPQQLAELFDLRERQRLFARRQILLERVERAVGRRAVAEDRDPVVDLGALDLHGRLELFLRTHHRMGRHLAEVAREHRVAAALLDLLVRRGAGAATSGESRSAAPSTGAVSRSNSSSMSSTSAVCVDAPIAGVSPSKSSSCGASAGRGFLLPAPRAVAFDARHRMERRVAASFMAGDRGRAALALAHDRCFLARERVGGLDGSLRCAESGRRRRRRNRALRSTRCGKLSARRARRGIRS